jgi:hypothetical protein
MMPLRKARGIDVRMLEHTYLMIINSLKAQNLVIDEPELKSESP